MSDDILKNRLKRAGITPEEYNRAIHPPTSDEETASDQMMRKLNVYIKMEPSEEKTKLWDEIHSLFPDVADELHEVSNKRPSAYILADQLKAKEDELQERLDKLTKKPSFWSLLNPFGKKK